MVKPSSIYSVHRRDTADRIAAVIDHACQKRSKPALVFFRADDIGIPSRQFQLLIDCFLKHRLPLCLAVVPTWTTNKRFAEIKRLTGTSREQWCWHQHGRLHQNFEQGGKKQEFGPSRSREEIKNSLQKGRKRLQNILAEEFQPFFTPPWNRCSMATIESLAELNFFAISRSRGAKPETIEKLPDFQVGVDLHTRKEVCPDLGFKNLLTELQETISSGQCGIMIHHQRMNSNAFELLDILLEIIKNSTQLIPVLFGDLVQ